MTIDILLANFSHLAEAPNGIKKLRELVLQLAVQGKLVPQDPDDEPASELLKKIQAEKQRLIQEGKICKSKPLPPFGPDEIPNDIPESWEWTRIREITHDLGQKVPDIPFTYIDVTAIDKERGCIFDEAKVLEADQAPSRARKLVAIGSVIYSTVRPYLLNIAVVNRQFDPDPIVSTAFAVLHPFLGICSDYLYYYLRSPSFIEYVNGAMTGMAYPAINDAKMSVGPLPLPPLAEQKRIVAKVDALMALCDELEAKQQEKRTKQIALNRASLHALTQPNGTSLATAWHRVRDHFGDLYTMPETVAELRQTILQLAVMGRLVPQDPNDEPASELLKKIQAEKQRLIAEGAIRKPRRSVSADNGELRMAPPRGWVAAQLEDAIAALQTGPFGSTLHKRDYVADGIPVINPKHYRSGEIFPERAIAVDEATHRRLSSYQLRKDDVILARRGEMGRCAVVTEKEDGWLCGTGSAILRLPAQMEPRFIKLLLETPAIREYLGGESVGSTMTNLNQGILLRMPLAIPPSNEQKRIVAKVDKLMTLCNVLEARLQQAQTDADDLLTAIVHELITSSKKGDKICQ